MTFSRTDVTAAYQALLGNQPEDEGLIAAGTTAASLEELLTGILASDAYATRSRPTAAALNLPPIEIETTAPRHDLRRMHDHINAVWSRLGEEQPYWSVWTNEDFRVEAFAENEARFNLSGQYEVDNFAAFIKRAGLSFGAGQTCFELGCGVGRLTQWLAPRFDRVIAADVSASHLKLAAAQFGKLGIANVSLVRLASLATLRSLPRFDVFFSLIVLQHNPPPIIRFLLRAMLRKLRRGGLAYFQVPTYLRNYSFNVAGYLARLGKDEGMELHGFPQKEVLEIVIDSGCRLLEMREDGWSHTIDGMISNTFLVEKPRWRRASRLFRTT